MPAPKARTSRWRQVLRRLERQHGRPQPTDRRPPLEQLVLGLLSDQTSERKAAQALKRLHAEFVDFNELRVTRPHNTAEVIQTVADPERKAKRVRRVLQQLFLKNGTVELDFLQRLPLDQARGFLEQLEGVDARTVATVVLLSLGGNALPADAAVSRLSKRIGLVGRSWHTEQVQQALERAIPADDKFAFYRLMVVHGEQVCLVKTTRCEACTLNRMCEASRVRPGRARSASARGSRQAASAGRRHTTGTTGRSKAARSVRSPRRTKR